MKTKVLSHVEAMTELTRALQAKHMPPELFEAIASLITEDEIVLVKRGSSLDILDAAPASTIH